MLMQKTLGLIVGAAVGLMSLGFQARPVKAAEAIIDDFSAAEAPPGTLLNTNPGTENVYNDALGTVMGLDTAIAGVIGGNRKLNVQMIGCSGCPGDNVIVGVEPSAKILDYNSTFGADAAFELIYDGGGMLNRSLAFAEGIRLSFINIDLSSYPIEIMVTLTSDPNSASSSTIIGMGGTDLIVDFPFSNFPTVDVSNLSTITIFVNPNDGTNAGDLQMTGITTFGTPTEEDPFCDDGVDNDNDDAIDCVDPDCLDVSPCVQAPVMSPLLIGLLVAVLGAGGILGVGRGQIKR
jgi:hypothetical protein